MDLGETLGKRVGPLPVGVWILAIGGGLAVAVFVRSRAAGDEGAELEPGAGINTDTAPGAGNLAGVGDDDVPTTGRPTTNEEWFTQAVDAILGTRMGYNPSAVSAALTKYLDGQRLTVAENAIVSMAIRLIGPPPVPPPVPPPGDDDDPPNNPTPQTPVYPGPPGKKFTIPARWHTVKKGQSIADIARYYGMSTGRLYEYNLDPKVRSAKVRARIRKAGPNGNLPAGSMVKIPPTPATTIVGTGA